MVFQPIDATQYGITLGKCRLNRLRMFRQFTPLSVNSGLQCPMTLCKLQEFRVHS